MRIGETVSHYRVVGTLGEGGMGIVYRAEDVRLGRAIALKVLAPRLAADALARRRFAVEARAASALDHPNICALYDVGETADGSLFLALAFCEGETLAKALENGPLPAERALAIAAQVADGLGEAHAKGIVHRDVKPANLMLRPDGLVKILDFGVARLELDAGITAASHAVGSPAYMAPEQVRGERVGPGADLWSLGVVLYETIAGQRPFAGELAFVLDGILNRRPTPLEELRPGLHPGIASIVARALEKDAAARYASAGELARDLRRICAAGSEATRVAASTLESPHEWRPTPPRAPSSPRLPLPATRFVGRSGELERLRRLLAEERRRLVTLTGPGGVGKTRIAIEAARQVEASFRDGAAFVALAELEDAAQVTRRIAETLDAREGDGRGLDLGALLRSREILLVLDNLEHLLAAAPALGELLAACPGVAVLATSREVLHLSGEIEIAVEPLGLPAPFAAGPAEVAACDAVRLFVERAREVNLDFTVTAESATAVAAICQRLDGLPLALELAASRLRLFSPQALLRRLRDHEEKLVARARDLPERQRTLDATIAWSYELLSEPERRLLRQLAVFAGGFSLEEARVVCESLDLDLEEGLFALSDKSLVRQLAAPAVEPRFGLLVTIRDWIERLPGAAITAEREGAAARHADCFLALAERAERELASVRRGPWLDRLRAESDNLRAALRHVIQAARADRALRAMGGLGWAWYHLGWLSEGRRWIEQALDLPAVEGDRGARVRALTAAARLARYQDDFAAGRAWAEEGVLLARERADPRELAFALNVLGLNAQPLGDPAAIQAADESVVLMRQAGDEWGTALCVFYLGTFAFFLGREDLVRPSLEESAELFRSLGDRWGLAGALFYLGWVEERAAHRHRARELLEESVALLRLENDKWRTAFALRRLAELQDDTGAGDALRAEAHELEEMLGIRAAYTPSPTPDRSTGDRPEPG